MATATQVIGRLSLIVAYTDGSNGAAAASLDERGNISSDVNSTDDFKEFETEKGSDFTDMFVTKLGIASFSVAAPTGSKAISDYVAECSGRVTYDDGTSADFCVQYTTKTGVVEVITSNATVINDVSSVSSLATKLDALLETLGGTGSVTL